MNDWIKVEYHYLTDKESLELFGEKNSDRTEKFYKIDSKMPFNEESVIVTDGEDVWVDTNIIDGFAMLESGICWTEIKYWMRLPMPLVGVVKLKKRGDEYV